MAIYGLVRSSLAKKEELTGEEMADIVRKAEQLGGGPKGVADGCGNFPGKGDWLCLPRSGPKGALHKRACPLCRQERSVRPLPTR